MGTKNYRVTQEELAKKYDVSHVFVGMALRGERNSQKAVAIRKDYARQMKKKADLLLAA